MAVAGSIVVTTTQEGPFAKYSIAWTCSAGGAVTENAVALMAGRIVQVVCTPDDTDVPTDDYDVSLLPASGETDLLGGGGTDMSATLVNFVGVNLADLPVWIPAGNYWPTVAAAGAAKKGVIDIYMV